MENVAKRRQGKPSAEPRRQSESSADVMSYGSINHPEANSLFRHWATTLSRGGVRNKMRNWFGIVQYRHDECRILT
jgi:hypothetical protein